MGELIKPIDNMRESLQAALLYVLEDNILKDKLAAVEELRTYATDNGVSNVEFVDLYADLLIEDPHVVNEAIGEVDVDELDDDLAEEVFDRLTNGFKEIYGEWIEGRYSNEEFELMIEQSTSNAKSIGFSDGEIELALIRGKEQYHWK